MGGYTTSSYKCAFTSDVEGVYNALERPHTLLRFGLHGLEGLENSLFVLVILFTLGQNQSTAKLDQAVQRLANLFGCTDRV